MRNLSAAMGWRIVRTLGALAVVWALGRLVLPGLDREAVGEVVADVASYGEMFDVWSGFSVGVLGIWPWASSFVLLEIVSGVRRGLGRSPLGRETLTTSALGLGLFVALLQAWFISRNFMRMELYGSPLVALEPGPFYWVSVPTLVAGACVHLALAAYISGRGFGSGLNLLIGVDLARAWGDTALWTWARADSLHPADYASTLAMSGGVAGLTWMVLAGKRLRPFAATPEDEAGPKARFRGAWMALTGAWMVGLPQIFSVESWAAAAMMLGTSALIVCFGAKYPLKRLGERDHRTQLLYLGGLGFAFFYATELQGALVWPSLVVMSTVLVFELVAEGRARLRAKAAEEGLELSSTLHIADAGSWHGGQHLRLDLVRSAFPFAGVVMDVLAPRPRGASGR